MRPRYRELLFQIGLVLGAIVLGKWLDFPLGYVAAAVLAVAFTVQWVLTKEEGEEEIELQPFFGRHIPRTETRAQQTEPDVDRIDGEVYRIAINPRSVSWELVRDIYRIQGRPQDAKIDCDVLLELYLVNKSKKISNYVRDLRLSAELNNGETVNFERQDDLHAIEFNNTQYEYGLEHKDNQDKEPINQLFSSLPFCLSPAQAVEGWVRFMAETNPESLDAKSFKLRVVDSLEVEHPIVKVTTKERKGRIGLRRVPS